MKTELKVTVCVLTYNQEQYIRSCLQSIVDQHTDFTFDLIVADDCSTDGTSAIVEEFAKLYPNVVKPVLRPVNIGGTNNFVETHNLATGMYVAHIDGDDLMLPGKLQKQVEFLDANPDFTVVWHRINLFDDNGGFVSGEEFDLSFFPNGTATLEHSLRIGNVGAHSAIMYRRRARKTRQVDFEIIDLFYTWEYLSSGKGKILDDVLGSYRVAAKGSMQLKDNSRVARIAARNARYYLHLMPGQRRNIFSFALFCFLSDLKHCRSSIWSSARTAIESLCPVSPIFLLRNYREMQKLAHLALGAGSALLPRSRRKVPET
jgi:glycosyltransferase involved in cell wall biosynthesis